MPASNPPQPGDHRPLRPRNHANLDQLPGPAPRARPLPLSGHPGPSPGPHLPRPSLMPPTLPASRAQVLWPGKPAAMARRARARGPTSIYRGPGPETAGWTGNGCKIPTYPTIPGVTSHTSDAFHSDTPLQLSAIWDDMYVCFTSRHIGCCSW